MAYYTKETLKTKVEQLNKATGLNLTLISCNGEYALQDADNNPNPFSWAEWYRPVKSLIIYLEGALDGLKAAA